MAKLRWSRYDPKVNNGMLFPWTQTFYVPGTVATTNVPTFIAPTLTDGYDKPAIFGDNRVANLTGVTFYVADRPGGTTAGTENYAVYKNGTAITGASAAFINRGTGASATPGSAYCDIRYANGSGVPIYPGDVITASVNGTVTATPAKELSVTLVGEIVQIIG